MRQLEGLLGTARGRVAIGVRGGNSVKLGDKVVFEVNTEIGGRLAILDINAEREVVLIYPNKFTSGTDIGKVSVPGPDYPGFTAFQAVEPVGKGRLVALVVPEEFQIERFIADKTVLAKEFTSRQDAASYVMRLIRQVEVELAVREDTARRTVAEVLKRWGYAMVDYEIVR